MILVLRLRVRLALDNLSTRDGCTMAVPTPLHYWLVRLRALNRPRLWGAGLGLLLLGLVGYQYLGHPEWLRTFALDETDSARPTPEDNLANLSQAELADMAEIDNLTLLLNQLQPLTADTLTEAPTSGSAAPTVLERLSPTNSEGQAEPASPFALYLERTRFRIGNTVESPSPALEARSSLPSQVGRGRSAADPGAASPTPSPLQQLLNPPPNATTNPLAPTAAEATASEPGATATPERLSSTEPTGLTPPPWAVEGQIPGVNQRFIRTTPEMSPPPGTTGYRPPPSLAPAPSALPNSPPLPGLAPAAASSLNLSPGPALPGAVTAPSAGNTLPPAGTSTYTPPPVVETPPFSAPRPPGSHTGGGYIYTFSDPSGPGN